MDDVAAVQANLYGCANGDVYLVCSLEDLRWIARGVLHLPPPLTRRYIEHDRVGGTPSRDLGECDHRPDERHEKRYRGDRDARADPVCAFRTLLNRNGARFLGAAACARATDRAPENRSDHDDHDHGDRKRHPREGADDVRGTACGMQVVERRGHAVLDSSS